MKLFGVELVAVLAASKPLVVILATGHHFSSR